MVPPCAPFHQPGCFLHHVVPGPRQQGGRPGCEPKEPPWLIGANKFLPPNLSSTTFLPPPWGELRTMPALHFASWLSSPLLQALGATWPGEEVGRKGMLINKMLSISLPESFLSTFHVCYSFNLHNKAGANKNPTLQPRNS